MLIGQYSGVLSEKRRVAIPRRFLDELGEQLIVSKWFENCLILVGTKFWDELFERLTGGNRVKTYSVRDNERFVLGSAFEVSPDDQGRVILPEVLVEYANLEKEIVFLGLRDRVEVWSAEFWKEKNQKLHISARELIEKL